MKRLTLATTLAVAAIAGMTTLASAESNYRRYDYNTNTPVIDATEARQNRQIEKGLRSGQLTWREYFGLKREQANIERLEARAKADGVVTERERRQIRDAQAEAQKHIYQETHNNEVNHRRVYRWWWGRY